MYPGISWKLETSTDRKRAGSERADVIIGTVSLYNGHSDRTLERYMKSWFVFGLLWFRSHRQRGHLETAPQFTVPCEGPGARFIYRSHRESNHWPSRCSPLNYRCATLTPIKSWKRVFVWFNQIFLISGMTKLR